jgi:DNA-binding MarR family transcriptional regulator
MPNKPQRLNDCFCKQLRRASVSLTKYYDGVLLACGVTVGQYSVLFNIDLFPGSSISELAALMEADRSTLSRTLKPLFKQNLVINTKESGQRDYQLELTPAGRNVMENGRVKWTEAQTGLAARLNDQGLEAWERVMGVLEKL